MTSSNKTVSRKKSVGRQQCKIYEVSALLPANVDRRPSLLLPCSIFFLCYITNYLMTGPEGNLLFPDNLNVSSRRSRGKNIEILRKQN